MTLSGWDTQSLCSFLPNDICMTIESMPPSPTRANDVAAWNATTNGAFTMKSFYNIVTGSYEDSGPLFQAI